MSRQAVDRRFIFHGNAVALAAHIRGPGDFLVPAVASSCLPVTGGVAEAESAGRNFNDIISYDSASTTVKGDYVDGQGVAELARGKQAQSQLPAMTTAECRVTGLKIHSGSDEFRADELELQAVSTANPERHTEFASLRTAFRGISVNGYRLKVETDTELFTKYETKEKLCRAYEQSGQFRKRYGKRFYPTGKSSNAGCLGWLFGAKNRIPEAGGVIVATLVPVLDWEPKPAPGTKIRGNKLIIDGLGSIYFGEVIIEEEFRRVTLIRFQLGSSNVGEGTVCEVQSDTHPWPPKGP